MNDIALHIYDYHCVNCGRTWTHSEPIMRTEDGGYVDLSSPKEFDKWLAQDAFVTCYQRRQLYAPICHQCLYLNLPEGYPPPRPKKEVPHAKRKDLSHEDLEALLRS